MTEQYEHLVARIKALSEFAVGFIPTELSLHPEPDEVMALAEDLELLADKVDPIITAYAEYFEAMTGHKINRTAVPVVDVLAGALDGMLTYEIQSEAECIAMEREEEEVA